MTNRSATCPHCTHRAHDYLKPGDAVYWCRESTCLCGVDPCNKCGALERFRVRRYDEAERRDREFCRHCGNEYPYILLA